MIWSRSYRWRWSVCSWLGKIRRAKRCLVDHLVYLVICKLVYRVKHSPWQNALQSRIVIREVAELPWLLSRTLGVWEALILPLYFFFLSSFLFLSPSSSFFFFFFLSFSRVGNCRLKMARWSWQILAPDQSLNALSIKSLPCLFKFHEFPLKRSPEKIVLNPWERCCGRKDTHISWSHCFCFIQCVGTDHKFKQDKSDNECVSSGPDTGQTLLCLLLFFSPRQKNVWFIFLCLLYRWEKN